MFSFYKSLKYPNFPTAELLPSTASETYAEGETLKLASGALTKASGTDTPAYICAQAYTAPSSGQKEIFVYPVLPDQIYRVKFTADATAVPIGSKVTVSSNGLGITATTTSGVAKIIKKLGTGAAGTYALVQF